MAALLQKNGSITPVTEDQLQKVLPKQGDGDVLLCQRNNGSFMQIYRILPDSDELKSITEEAERLSNEAKSFGGMISDQTRQLWLGSQEFWRKVRRDNFSDVKSREQVVKPAALQVISDSKIVIEEGKVSQKNFLGK